MKTAVYQGYEMHARPCPLAEGGRWSTNVEISREDGSTVIVVPYSAANTFETREDAAWHSLDFGRRIIDGAIPGCTAP